MATEYFIVKPSTKQTFYLGKRISCLEGLSRAPEAKYPTWECYEDVIFDLQENSRYFLEGSTDATVGQIWDLCAKIWEFCDSEVYMDNDCSDTCKIWSDWECINVFEEIFELTDLEKWSELFLLIPQDKWVTHEEDGVKIVDEYETVLQFIKSNV